MDTKINSGWLFCARRCLNAKSTFIVLLCIGLFCHILISPVPGVNPFSGGQDSLLFSDFFNCLSAIDEGGPYMPGSATSIYPPLANLVFLPFSYTGDYAGMSLEEARSFLPGLSACAFYLLLLAVLFFYSLIQLGGKYSFSGWPLLLFLFVPELLFGVQRANIVLLAGACINFFLLYYDSEDDKERKKGLFFLCLAVALKLWPVLLGFLILVNPHNKNNKWREILWCVVVTTLLLTLPFLCFQGGFRNLPVFVNGLLGWGKGDPSSWVLEFGVHNFGMMLGVGLGLSEEMSSTLFMCSKWLTYAMAAVSIFLVFKDKVYWRRVMLMMLIVLMVPDKIYYYYGIYLIPVTVIYLGAKDKSIWGLLNAICLAVVFGPLSFLFSHMINIAAVLFWVLVMIQSGSEVWRNACKKEVS